MEQYEKNILKAALTAAAESMMGVLKEEPIDFDKCWAILQKQAEYYQKLSGKSIKDNEPCKGGAGEPASDSTGIDRLRRTDK